MRKSLATLLTALIPFSCAMAETGELDLNREVKPATAFTAQANAAVYDELDFSDKQEYAFATRGLIDAPETLELKDEDGRMIWSQDAFAFLDDYEKAPDSVNPSLWENTINNHVYGLFEVADGIYQVRGYDMANLTVVKGDTGWIVFDTLMSVECSQAAMQLIEKNTAAVYKYINDQTLTYINQGYTSDEISNMIELPEALNKIWYTRPYYGTVAHNAKAVYQKFMGWYDSNPVNLNPLTPSDSAKKWVEYLGDVDKALQMAKADFDKGEYQWVAEITNAIVFADPTNIDARLLCADAMEQLGYQAESGPWRNEYLTAAQELRHGNANLTAAAQELRHGNANLTAAAKNTGEMVKALSAPMLFDYMAIVMDKQALADEDFTVNVTLPDVGERHMLRVKNGVLLVYKNTLSDSADVSVTCPKNALFAILTNNQETVAKAVQIKGRAELLTRMMENMNQFRITGTNPFNIIEP